MLSSKLMTGELIEKTVAAAPGLICISAIPPGSVLSATHLCKRLRGRLDGSVITVGLWRAQEDPRHVERLKRAHADHIFTTLNQAAVEIRAQCTLATATTVTDEKAA